MPSSHGRREGGEKREEKRGRRREGGEEREESDQSAEVNNVTVRITSSPCFGA